VHSLLEKVRFSSSAPGFVGVTALFERLIGKTPAKMCGYASIRRSDLQGGL
jgi:hypothetical protein